MIPLLRTLTRKSKLGFGKYKHLTVQHIIDMKMPLVLISPYYKLSSINYTDDILMELGIIEECRIKKPSINIEKYYEFLEMKGFEKRKRGEGADALKKESKPLTRRLLQSINQGK